MVTKTQKEKVWTPSVIITLFIVVALLGFIGAGAYSCIAPPETTWHQDADFSDGSVHYTLWLHHDKGTWQIARSTKGGGNQYDSLKGKLNERNGTYSLFDEKKKYEIATLIKSSDGKRLTVSDSLDGWDTQFFGDTFYRDKAEAAENVNMKKSY